MEEGQLYKLNWDVNEFDTISLYSELGGINKIGELKLHSIILMVKGSLDSNHYEYWYKIISGDLVGWFVDLGDLNATPIG